MSKCSTCNKTETLYWYLRKSWQKLTEKWAIDVVASFAILTLSALTSSTSIRYGKSYNSRNNMVGIRDIKNAIILMLGIRKEYISWKACTSHGKITLPYPCLKNSSQDPAIRKVVNEIYKRNISVWTLRIAHACAQSFVMKHWVQRHNVTPIPVQNSIYLIDAKIGSLQAPQIWNSAYKTRLYTGESICLTRNTTTLRVNNLILLSYYIRSSPCRTRPGLLPSCYGPGPLVNIYLPSGYP